VRWPEGAEAIDLRQARRVRTAASHRLLGAVGVARGKPGPAKDVRQCQSLPDEGHEDHRERQEQDQVSLREAGRQREGGRQ